MCWRVAMGGEDEPGVDVGRGRHRLSAALAALGAGGREQKQRPAFPYAADLSSIRPERLNRLAIPIIAVRHIFSFMKNGCRLGRHSCCVRGSFFAIPLLRNT